MWSSFSFSFDPGLYFSFSRTILHSTYFVIYSFTIGSIYWFFLFLFFWLKTIRMVFLFSFLALWRVDNHIIHQYYRIVSTITRLDNIFWKMEAFEISLQFPWLQDWCQIKISWNMKYLFFQDSVRLHSEYNLEALVWCLVLGIYLLRFMTLGNKTNRKYKNLSVLLTEQVRFF